MSDLPGIDISGWQTTTPSLTGQDFVVARATYGGKTDAMYATHKANVRAAGKAFGAYHFWYDARNTVSIATQVAAFLAVAGDVDMLVLDLEGTNAGTTEGIAQAADFISRVHATGRKIGLYHSLSGFPAVGQDFNWIAYWASTEPSKTHAIWQYGDTTIGGKAIDGDRFNGDAAALATLFGGTQAGTGGIDTMALYQVTAQKGTWKVTAGKVAHGLKPDVSGFIQSGKTLSSGSGHYDQLLARLDGVSLPSQLIHVTDGTLAGLYVSKYEVDEVADPVVDATPFSQADIDAAVAAQKAADDASAPDCTAAVAAQQAADAAELADIQAQLAAANQQLTAANASLAEVDAERKAARALLGL